MKRLVFATLFAIIAVGTTWGQDCSNWTNFDLRGTYAISGSTTMDPSLLLPGMGFPAGSVPGFYVGAFGFDGRGAGSAGWISTNLGGSQFTFQMVGIKYSMQPDCSVQMSLTWKIKELGVTFTVQRVGVVVPMPGGLQLHMSLVGASPGKPPGPGFDLGIAYRISMN